MPFRYENRILNSDGVALADIAERAGTPVYVYSANDIRSRYREYDAAFGETPHGICYAVKANSNLSLLQLLAREGAGFDIVSGGELYRVLRAGGDPGKVVFSGVGKTLEEIEYALRSGIHSFNCESEPELALIDSLAARLGMKARVALRVNPDVDASTHPYISTGLREHKFGIDISEVEQVYAKAMRHPNLLVEGVSCHIGSQLLDPRPMLEAFDRMVALVDRLRGQGVPIQDLDLGGGIGVPYRPGDVAPPVQSIIEGIRSRVAGRNLRIFVEPGRSIVGEAGVLLTRVLYRKANGAKEFVIVDAAMNDLIRPALYQSHHEIIPVRQPASNVPMIEADVVGPVCESGDFFARSRALPAPFPGDLLAIMTAGAYGFVQSSNYNSRVRAAEVLVQEGSWRYVRKREAPEDLVRGEVEALA
jgi:diaminopimelate decarboxylase